MDKPTKEEVLATFSNNMKYIRAKKGITQEAFAYRLGISLQSLGSYEEARATPCLPVLIQISNLLDYGIDCLLTIDIKTLEEA